MSIIWLWVGFIVLIVFLLALDLGVLNRKAHVPSFRESLAWSMLWITVALAFNVGIYFIYENHLFGIGMSDGEVTLTGAQAAKLFFTGYIVEKSLSLDNVFVIGMVFAFFAVPPIYQHRVLFWGIIGALVLRCVMILFGVALIEMFEWMLYVFGAMLLLTAIKMLWHQNKEIKPEDNPLVKLARRFVPMTPNYHKDRFFVRENGRLVATPMFLVLLIIEGYDVVFAVDSIPAIFAITQEPFIIFTSNIFAILGLRSLYFVMMSMITKFGYLKISLSVILAYVGLKLLVQELIRYYYIEDLMNWISLGVIIAVMIIGVLASVWKNKRNANLRNKTEGNL